MRIKTIEGNEFSSTEANSILDSALLAGFIFEYSCKNGLCGVCKTTLIEGKVLELKSQFALTDEEKKNHKILTCCCEPVSDVVIDAEDLTRLKNIDVKTLPVRISEINFPAKNIIEVVLRFPPAASIKFLEGQYLDVLWNNIRRSYSIASTSLDKKVKLLIKKVDQGQMSDYWFDQAQVNDLLRIEGPKGTFFIRDAVKPLVFLATGTGIAPIMSILTKIDQDSEFTQQHAIHLFWGNRYKEDFVWQPMFKNIEVSVEKVISKSDKDWGGETGYVQMIALEKLGAKLVVSDVYACGSNAMIQSSKQVFSDIGLPEKQFYSDAFVQSF
ncbi:2Fe-2S iron-sulfur cluster-binding protein [Thiomicrorhabdus arctica]|uniref:2Fe-2S iron-sulfur cluster-binding protein n=1 Tax=Thiomicrorhabdus arctica TaxID=131540 RepID=UPI00039F0C9D|nr:2Fe-2S iron-sulfur cluster-binding protein [Thiomicrorhabdus arctica]